MATKKVALNNIFLVTKACVTGDLDDAPEFVAISFTKQLLVDIQKYQQAIAAMKKAKLDPYKVKEFHSGMTFKSSYALPLNDEGVKHLMFLDKGTKETWEDNYEEPEGEKTHSSWEEMTDKNNTPDCGMLGVKDDGIIFDAFIKHTNVRVESETVPNAMIKKIAKKLGVAYAAV